MTEIERMKLNSLKEVSAYGIMEIKSKLQLDSLNVMKDTDDDEPGVRFDLLSQCLLLETVKDFIASFRPESKQQQQGTTPATWSGKSLDALASKPPAAAAASGASGASTTTTTVSAPQMDGQEWAKLVALKKAMVLVLPSFIHLILPSSFFFPDGYCRGLAWISSFASETNSYVL